MRRLLNSLLEGLPIAISECHDGARVLQACAEIEPDYAVIDLNLAGVEALGLVRRIVSKHPQVRVVLLGEDDDSRLRSRAIEAGVWRYLVKESLIDLRRLLDLISADAENQDA